MSTGFSSLKVENINKTNILGIPDVLAGIFYICRPEAANPVYYFLGLAAGAKCRGFVQSDFKKK